MHCANCGAREFAVEQYHVHLGSDQVVEVRLCEECRHKFVSSDWVEFVI